MPTQTQLVVIGAGPGGYAAAFYAADLGMDVTLIDREANPGGVCVYRGCIPSKALLHVAKLVEEARHAAAWGVEFGEPKVNLDKLRAFKDAVVGRLTGGTGQLVKARKVKYLRGTATLTGPTSLNVAKVDGGSEQVTFQHAIIAIGSQPAKVPGLSLDSPRVMDSTSALDLESVPGSLLVVGGGYIGLELGSVYAALGSKVTVVEMTPGLLPGADRDLVDVLAKKIEKAFDKVLLSTKVVGMTEQKDGLKVTFEDPEGARRDQVFDKVLVSVGRKPNKMAGLETTKVETDRRGFIKINAPATDRRAHHLRHRRHRRRPDARAQGQSRRARRSGGHPRRRRRVRAGGDSGGGVHRSGTGLGRTDRDRGEAGRPQGRGREVPLGGLGPIAHARSHRRADQARHRARLGTRAGRGHRRARRGRA